MFKFKYGVYKLILGLKKDNFLEEWIYGRKFCFINIFVYIFSLKIILEIKRRKLYLIKCLSGY